MKFSTLVAIALTLGLSAGAHADWAQIQTEAKGQTVYFNAWGGGEAINSYIDWAAKEAKTRYGIEVRHVKVTDAAEVVKRREDVLVHVTAVLLRRQRVELLLHLEHVERGHTHDLGLATLEQR